MKDIPALPVRVEIRLESDHVAVREGLRHLFTSPPLCNLSPDLRGSTEIVLAEVVNNIVEHAYLYDKGFIDISLIYAYPTLSFEIVDTGLPMPSTKLPAGDLVALDRSGELPEGGFGWFLIRNLARGLEYRRKSSRNILAFWMDAR